jgi:hypothetical protein
VESDARPATDPASRSGGRTWTATEAAVTVLDTPVRVSCTECSDLTGTASTPTTTGGAASSEHTVATTRGLLYTLARLMGDVNAVKKGTVGKRIARRTVGKATGRWLGWLFR